MDWINELKKDTGLDTGSEKYFNSMYTAFDGEWSLYINGVLVSSGNLLEEGSNGNRYSTNQWITEDNGDSK